MTQDEALRALEALPAEMRDRALARLKDEAEKLRVLQSLVQEGLDDVATGRVVDWDVTEFLAEMEAEERSEPRIAQR